MRERRSHCQRDHAFTPENTYVNSRGERECRECRRVRQLRQGRRPVTCPDCNVTRLVSRGGVKPDRRFGDGVCQPCAARRVNGARIYQGAVEVTDDLRQWWIDNFTPEQIRELAAGLSGGFRVFTQREAA